MSSPIVFVNVGWMIHYYGPSAADPTLGGHGHLKTSNVGHEAWNFRPYRGQLLGYVPRSATINLTRLGGRRDSKSVTGITVVWMAKSPRDKKNYIVGWYTNATIYCDNEHLRVARGGDVSVGYQIAAKPDGAKLLAVDARVFQIPTAKEKGNLGQSPLWYGRDDVFRERVRTYIEDESVMVRLRKTGKSPRQQDVELRRKIEQAAINHAIAHYTSPEGGNRTVKSVEVEGKGWDLEATSADGDVLYIEVKGLSGSEVVVELTPNEYARMKSDRTQYVVYILSSALEKSRAAHVFRFDAEQSSRSNLVWEADDGRILVIEERVAARLSAVRPVASV